MEQQRSPQTQIDFLDFELEIGPRTDGMYPVAVIRSPAGEVRGVMHFPFDGLTLENRLLMLQNALLSSGGGRRHILLSEDQDVKVQDFGSSLFNALFTRGIDNLYVISQREAALQNKGLRLKLRILSPEMAALPWEFLYDPDRAEYICLSRNTPLIRYIELPQPPQPLLVTHPLRILGMVATPANLPPLDVQREQQRIEKAIEVLQQQKVIELMWLSGQTWRDVQQAMRNGPWHVFHFIGHGSFDVSADEGLVAFTDEAGQADLLRASQLGRMLADHRPLRMVVLNACEGAQGGRFDIFSSTASVLVRYGLPAVLAMQFAIKDSTAIVLSRAFYEALADGMPIDVAVSEARKAVSFSEKDTLEWGIPALYMRAPDGILFTINQSSPPQLPHIATTDPDGSIIRPRNGTVEPGRATTISPRSRLPAVPFSPGVSSSLFKAIALIILTLLILGSIGVIYLKGINRIDVQATATASAHVQLTATAAATAYAKGITTNGMMFGFDAQHTHFNSYEKVLNSKNVPGLAKDWQVAVGKNDMLSSSPAVVGGVVYIGSSDGDLYTFDALKGRSLCPDSVGGYAHNSPAEPFVQNSPAVANGMVYIGSKDHNLYAFNATGSAIGLSGCGFPPLWTASTGGSISSSPTVANSVVFVGSTDHNLYAFNANGCGARKICLPLWTASTGGVINAAPAVYKGVIYVGSEDHRLYAFDANGCGQPPCSPLWTASTGDVISSSDVISSAPAVDNGVVYIGSDNHKLYAFNANGCASRICSPLWTALTGGGIFSSPAVAEGIVYVGSEDSNLYAFNANGCGQALCSPLWIASTNNAIDSSPTVANGVIFVGSADHKLYAFNANGCGQALCSPLWTASTGDQVDSSPAVANGVIYVGSFDGNLYAFHLAEVKV